MARALLMTDSATSRVVLPGSVLVGRHWRCDVRVDDVRVPLHWLELRWTGDLWAWRTLGAMDRTVGRGRSLPGGWRGFERDARIRLGSSGIAVLLVDDAPPALSLQDLDSGAWIDGDARFDTLALTADGPRLRGSDGEPAGDVLDDGALVALEGRRYRVHRPEPVAATVEGAVSLTDPGLSFDFDLGASTLRISTQRGEVQMQGSLVLSLAVYAVALAGGPSSAAGGWLTNVDAQVGLGELGIEMTAGPERMNWDRHRVRSALQELGVTGLERLFERKRMGRQWLHRIGVTAHVSGLEEASWTRPTGAR